MGTILFASPMTCPRNSPTESHDAASSLPALPTVDAALCLTNDRTVESWNAHFAARTSPMCGMMSWASCKNHQPFCIQNATRERGELTEIPKLTSSGTVLVRVWSWGTKCALRAIESCVRSSTRLMSFFERTLALLHRSRAF